MLADCSQARGQIWLPGMGLVAVPSAVCGQMCWVSSPERCRHLAAVQPRVWELAQPQGGYLLSSHADDGKARGETP